MAKLEAKLAGVEEAIMINNEGMLPRLPVITYLLSARADWLLLLHSWEFLRG